MGLRPRWEGFSWRMGGGGGGRGSCAGRGMGGRVSGGPDIGVRGPQVDGAGVAQRDAWVPIGVRAAGGGLPAPCCLRGRAGGGVLVCAAEGGCADGGRGEGAGLPEAEDLFEAGEDAREDGGDQGVQGSGRDSPTHPRGGGVRVAQAGEVGGQRGGKRLHSWVIYLISGGGARFFISLTPVVWRPLTQPLIRFAAQAPKGRAIAFDGQVARLRQGSKKERGLGRHKGMKKQGKARCLCDLFLPFVPLWPLNFSWHRQMR